MPDVVSVRRTLLLDRRRGNSDVKSTYLLTAMVAFTSVSRSANVSLHVYACSSMIKLMKLCTFSVLERISAAHRRIWIASGVRRNRAVIPNDQATAERRA